MGGRGRADRDRHGQPFTALAETETLLLQKLGAACVAAHNAYQMCVALPGAAFIAMEARHCAGAEMQALMAYAAAVGSARRRSGRARAGFVGSSSALGAAGVRRGRPGSGRCRMR